MEEGGGEAHPRKKRSAPSPEEQPDFSSPSSSSASSIEDCSSGCSGPRSSFPPKPKQQQDIRRFFLTLRRKEEIDRAVSRWFYHDYIPLRGVRSPYFKAMIKEVSRYGCHYEPPTYADLCTKYLVREKEGLEGLLSDIRLKWKKWGVSLIFDAWIDSKGRHIHGAIAYCRGTAYFLMSHYISKEGKSAANLTRVWKESIEFVGPENVVQIVASRENANRNAGTNIENEYPHIFFTPCMAHCLNHLLKDIGSIVENANLIRQGKSIVTFVNGHALLRTIFQKLTSENHNGKVLLSYSDTKFGYNFIMLERMQELRWPLKALFVCGDYQSSTFASTQAGITSHNIVMDDKFWKQVEHLLKVVEPIVLMMRLVDGMTPCIGKVYEGMDRILEHISRIEKDDKKFQGIKDLCTRRWNKYHSRIQSAAFALDPEFQLKSQETNREVRRDWDKVLEKMGSTHKKRRLLRDQLHYFRTKRGRFGTPDSQIDKYAIGSALWWENYGSDTKELQELAVKILSQGASSSPFERLFSGFGYAASKKRVRLLPSRTSDLVFVSANLRLLQSHRTIEKEVYIGFAKRESIPLLELLENAIDEEDFI